MLGAGPTHDLTTRRRQANEVSYQGRVLTLIAILSCSVLSAQEDAPGELDLLSRISRNMQSELGEALVPPSSAGFIGPLLPGDQEPPGESAADAQSRDRRMASVIEIALILTLLSLAPAILLSVTAFTRIIIVLSFVRRALSVQELPPNQVLLGLALFLTLFVMAPVLEDVNETAVQPYLQGELTLNVAGERAAKPLRSFLLAHTREDDLRLFAEVSRIEEIRTPEETPLTIAIPAFVLSELKTAFQMGFLLFLPFLVIDFVVSSILLSMGMFMLPPIVISTPFKILLFVLVDGWNLVVTSLIRSVS